MALRKMSAYLMIYGLIDFVCTSARYAGRTVSLTSNLSIDGNLGCMCRIMAAELWIFRFTYLLPSPEKL
jgi:hypothetical protein